MSPLVKYLKRLEVFGATPAEKAAGRYGNARIRHEIMSRMPDSSLKDVAASRSGADSNAARRALADFTSTGDSLPEDFWGNLAEKLRR